LIRYILLIITLSVLVCKTSFSQITITGTVYDITKKTPIEAVSVLTTSGKGTFTDSLGHYSINVKESDSIYFSFLNKPTPKYAVSTIQNYSGFDISILKRVQELPGVFIKQRNYKMDSAQNRTDYAKIFNFEKPTVRTSMLGNAGSVGVGVDLDELINMFRFKRTRSMLAFRKRLLLEEQDKYVSHRFNKTLIKKLTGLEGLEMDAFINIYKPSYAMSLQLNDLEFGQYIIETYRLYKAGVKVNPKFFIPVQEED
jgi:hypothetical protein